MSDCIELDLTLEDPTAITDGSSEASAHRTLTWIPGTSLLGAAVGILGVTPDDPRFASIFLSDRVRFLDGHPCVDGSRSRARPLSLATLKEHAGMARSITDRAAVEASHSESRPFDRCRGGFMLGNAEVDVSWPTESRDHVGLERDRRVAADGILFSYEAIPSGATFRSRVIVDDGDLLQVILDGFNQRGVIRIGRSRNGGYGRVGVVARRTDEPMEPESNELEPVRTITLASDFCPPAGESAMEGLKTALAATGLQIDDAWAETRVVRGFRGIWGLPRPAVEVLRRGSVFRVSGRSDPLSTEVLHAGIGRRRNEGFGRIAVNASIDGPVPTSHPVATVMPTAHSVEDSCVPGAIAGLHRRAIRREIDEVATAAVASDLGSRLVEQLAGSRRLRQSQLSNLRSAVAHPAVAENPRLAREWFDGVCEKSRGDAWRKTIVTNIDAEPDHSEDTFEEIMKRFLGDAGWNSAAKTICHLADRPNFAVRLSDPIDRHRLAATFLEGLVGRTSWERRRQETNQ
ncbi:hypothetical protein OAL71_01455 [Phycisphaerales bacterium]|nr:hypothetical protein [Phycisphaerales bacterium]